MAMYVITFLIGIGFFIVSTLIYVFGYTEGYNDCVDDYEWRKNKK